MRAESKVKKGKGKVGTIVLFLALPVLLLIVFTYIPFVDMFKNSLTDWDGISETSNFVGLKNYIRLFTDPQYLSVFKNTFYYLIGAVLQIAFALFLAYIVSAKYRRADFYKGVIFFPALLNGVAVSMIFLFFYREGGPLDDILVALGHNADTLPHWIGDSHMVNLSLVFAMLWRYIGQNVIVFSGAILSTDKVALEEAKLDGATDWQRFIYIVLPRLKPTIAVGMILAVKNAISIFEIPFIITGGENGSSTFVVQTIKTAFDSRKAGMASAMGIVLLVIILVISIIQNKYGVSEEDE